jgi:hypothetical protein
MHPIIPVTWDTRARRVRLLPGIDGQILIAVNILLAMKTAWVWTRHICQPVLGLNTTGSVQLSCAAILETRCQ